MRLLLWGNICLKLQWALMETCWTFLSLHALKRHFVIIICHFSSYEMFSYVSHEKLCLRNVGFGNYGSFKKKYERKFQDFLPSSCDITHSNLTSCAMLKFKCYKCDVLWDVSLELWKLWMIKVIAPDSRPSWTFWFLNGVSAMLNAGGEDGQNNWME